MKIKRLFLISIISATYAFCAQAAPAKCSKNNLSRCLDSVCAINSGLNKAARCQYCGTADAGTPPAQKSLSNITAGKSNKYAIGDKELKSAPTDPGKRYIWATTKCLEKLTDCTEDDVSDTYDKLIEQSCRAAGSSIQITTATESAKAKPSKTKCTQTLGVCMETKCGVSFENCSTDADFDQVLSNCGLETSGCSEYLAEVRKTFTQKKKNLLELTENALQALVTEYQSTRENKFNSTRERCKNKKDYNSCIATTCTKYMQDKCEDTETNETETEMAKQLCLFYDTACNTIK